MVWIKWIWVLLKVIFLGNTSNFVMLLLVCIHYLRKLPLQNIVSTKFLACYIQFTEVWIDPSQIHLNEFLIHSYSPSCIRQVKCGLLIQIWLSEFATLVKESSASDVSCLVNFSIEVFLRNVGCLWTYQHFNSDDYFSWSVGLEPQIRIVWDVTLYSTIGSCCSFGGTSSSTFFRLRWR
jgi:hypothetical protein